ncbi:MAG: DUF4097 family beta strand repeat-containing protein [Candidatus Babeliales bacterium]
MNNFVIRKRRLIMRVRYFLSFFLLCFCISSPLHTTQFKKVSSFFGGCPYEEILQKEYVIEKQGTVVIENIDGPITITTGWKKNTIFLKATKKSNKPDQLALINIIDKQVTPDKLLIKTEYRQPKTKGMVEYELIVPTDLRLQISVNHGSVKIQEMQGPISVKTVQGNIEIAKTNNVIHTEAIKSGSIMIDQSIGPISATAHHGDIIITHANQSILATTNKGHIFVACVDIPSTGSIRLETHTGPITLALPTTTNATFQGKTIRGTITSDHYLTLKPCTTKLNTMAWSRFKKEIDGIFGTGEAEIKCRNHHGNIKIVETAKA